MTAKIEKKFNLSLSLATFHVFNGHAWAMAAMLAIWKDCTTAECPVGQCLSR